MHDKSHDPARYTEHMLKNFVNPDHRKEVEQYLWIRKRVDKSKKSTMKNDVQALLALDVYLKDKPFQNVTQDDLLKWEEYLEKDYVSPGKRNKTIYKKGLSSNTIGLYEIHIKRFYKYLANKEQYKKGKRFQKTLQYPDCVSWISGSNSNGKELPIDKLLDQKELIQLLNVCEQPRDQTMIASAFYDAGLRISEAISLNVGNAGFDKLGGYFILPKNGKDLKTGMRKVRLFIMPSSTKYLKDYLNNHPLKNYPDAPLFYSRDPKYFPEVFRKKQNGSVRQDDFEKLRLSRPGIEGLLSKLCRLAGIKTITPHTLRHNSATLASKMGFNEMELRIRYGWSKTSTMPSKYVHLASRDLDDKIKIITGFKEPEKREDGILQPIICWNCKEENVPTNRFCSRCGNQLDVKKEEIIMDATTTGLSVQEMIKNPEFIMKMMNVMAQEWKRQQQNKK